MIIVMWPVDKTGLPIIEGAPIPSPSIEHTIKPCDKCGRDCWIGPAQLFKHTMTGMPKLCCWCVMPRMTADQEYRVVALDKTADDKRRRV